MSFIICTIHTILLNNSRWLGWAGYVAFVDAIRTEYNLGGRSEGYGPLGGGG
jgi:hypothetical protein